MIEFELFLGAAQDRGQNWKIGKMREFFRSINNTWKIHDKIGDRNIYRYKRRAVILNDSICAEADEHQNRMNILYKDDWLMSNTR